MYCPSCGTNNYDGATVCCSCGATMSALPAVLLDLPQQFTSLVNAVHGIGGATAIHLLDTIWRKMDDVEHKTVIELLVERAIAMTSNGKLDNTIVALLTKIMNAEGVELLFAEDSVARRTLERAIAVYMGRRLRDAARDGYDGADRSLVLQLAKTKILERVDEVAKAAALKHQVSIENMIRDKLSTEMESIVKRAVEKVAQDAIENVQAKKS